LEQGLEFFIVTI